MRATTGAPNLQPTDSSCRCRWGSAASQTYRGGADGFPQLAHFPKSVVGSVFIAGAGALVLAAAEGPPLAGTRRLPSPVLEPGLLDVDAWPPPLRRSIALVLLPFDEARRFALSDDLIRSLPDVFEPCFALLNVSGLRGLGFFSGQSCL